MKAELSQKFKYLGFLMTCGMIFYHCPVMESINAVGPLDHFVKISIDSVIRTTVTPLMSYFFAVTGFLLFRDFSMENYLSKIKKRVFSLFIPFVLWQILFTVFDNVFGYNQISFAQFMKTTFLLQCWPVDSALWYVYAVFLLSLLSPLVLLIIKRKNPGWGIILAVILLAELRTKIEIPLFKAILSYGYVENIVNYLPVYLVGAFYGRHYKDGAADGLIYLLSALFVAALLESMFQGLVFSMSMKLLPLALLYLLPPIHVLHDRKIYRLSFLMYALHQPVLWKIQDFVLDIYARYIHGIVRIAALAPIITRFVLLAFIIALAALIHWLLSKVSPRFLALLSGGRA